MTVAADDLPIGWELPRIAEVTETVPSTNPTKHPDQTFYYVDISSIDNKRHVITEAKPLLGAQAPSRARRPIQDGDVLFSNVRTYLRNIARVNEVPAPALASTGFTLLRPTSRVTQDYLFRYVTSDAFIADVTPLQTGSHYPATSDKTVREQSIPLPPVPQQREITRLLDLVDQPRDHAVNCLSRAGAALHDFRRAVLAAASSGRLTADWRAGRGLADADDVPAGWTQCRIGEVAASIRGGSTEPPSVEPTSYPILRSSSVRPFTIDFADVRYLSANQSRREDNFLVDGDLFITRLSGSIEYVGNAAVVKDLGGQRIQYPDRLFCCRLKEPAEAPFLQLAFAGPQIRRQIEAASRSAAGHQRISITDIKRFQFLRPPLDEQHEISRLAGALLARGGAVQAHIEQAARLFDRAAQVALMKAFRGELAEDGATR